MSKKIEKVLITGATGYVADQMLAFMKEQYETVLIDTREVNRRGEPVEGVNIVDLIDPDRNKYSHHICIGKCDSFGSSKNSTAILIWEMEIF